MAPVPLPWLRACGGYHFVVYRETVYLCHDTHCRRREAGITWCGDVRLTSGQTTSHPILRESCHCIYARTAGESGLKQPRSLGRRGTRVTPGQVRRYSDWCL